MKCTLLGETGNGMDKKIVLKSQWKPLKMVIVLRDVIILVQILTEAERHIALFYILLSLLLNVSVPQGMPTFVTEALRLVSVHNQ